MDEQNMVYPYNGILFSNKKITDTYSVTWIKFKNIKIIIRSHYTILEWLKIKRLTIPSTGRKVVKLEMAYTADGV